MSSHKKLIIVAEVLFLAVASSATSAAEREEGKAPGGGPHAEMGNVTDFAGESLLARAVAVK